MVLSILFDGAVSFQHMLLHIIFDQISLSVGTTKVETITDPQLTQTMRQRTKSGAMSNAYRQDQLGVYKDEQRVNIFSNGVGDKSDQSLFSLLGYENIIVNIAKTDATLGTDLASRSFSVDFDILYRPALAIFRYNHPLPPARYEIELENYILKLQIESRTLGDIAQNHIIPTAIKYQNVLIENVKGMNDIFVAYV